MPAPGFGSAAKGTGVVLNGGKNVLSTIKQAMWATTKTLAKKFHPKISANAEDLVTKGGTFTC